MRERSPQPLLRPRAIRLVLAVALFVCMVGGREVVAQESEDEVESPSPNSAAVVIGGALPLNNSVDAAANFEESGQFPDVAPGSVAVSNLPPITAFKGLSNSLPMKTMLKGLITAQVPVMFQTMMMVENGAATGYIGSLNTVSNLFANTLDTAQLDLRLKQIADPNGAWVEAYNKALINRQQDGQSTTWVASLWTLGGDTKSSVEEQLPDDQQAKVINTESKPVSQNDAIATPVPPQGSDSPPGQSKLLLYDILLAKTGSAGEDVHRLRKLRLFFDYYVGDYRLTEESANGFTYRVQKKDFVEASRENAIPPETEKSRGFKLRWWQNKKAVWKAWYTIFDKYCQFKVENPNKDLAIFQKKGPAAELDQDDLLKASAEDLRITVNLIDQIFKLWVQSSNIDDPTKVKCTFEGSADNTMPQSVTPARVDNCESDPKNCDRNKIMYKFVEKIALSKTLKEYRDAFDGALGLANGHSPFMLLLATEVMCKSLRINDKISSAIGQEVCDPRHFLDTLAYQNREGWVREMNQLSKLAQGYGGSSVFRGTSNSMTNFSPDMGGSQAP